MSTRKPSALPTLIGFGAVMLWSLLAVMTAASGSVPPFQLLAMTFAVGSLASMALWPFRPGAAKALRQPAVAWLVGVGGLFGYHFLYFTALRNAPPVEAGLLNYLWPMLIVLFSALLPGESLRWHHLAGAAIALSGAVIVVAGGSDGLAIRAEYAFGYGSALLAAIFWAAYSVLSRRLANVPTDAVTGFCLATALLSCICHLALETTVWPAVAMEWLAVIGLGLGPVGLAFYAWDIGVKRGDIQVLGAASYAAPLLSTLLLVVFGYASLTPAILVAGLLITLGALLAARDMLFTRRR